MVLHSTTPTVTNCLISEMFYFSTSCHQCVFSILWFCFASRAHCTFSFCISTSLDLGFALVTASKLVFLSSPALP